MSKPNRGFFDDDYDDEAPTQFQGNQGPPPAYPPQPHSPSPYDPAEAETRLPGSHGAPPPSYPQQQGPYRQDMPLEPTRLPGQMQGVGPYGNSLEEETSLGHDVNIGPIGFLVVKRPMHNRGHVHRLPPTCDIGRTDGHLRLHDKLVSRRHARIRQMEDPETGEPIFMLIDMDARTGTYINDSTQRIEGRVRLNQGDEIKMGDHVFVFMMLLD